MATRKPQNAYHHKDLRNALIGAATAMLKKKPIDKLSMRELAQATGVSHGAPYRHFADKSELLAAIAADGYDQITSLCGKAASRHRNDPLKALEAAGTGYLLFVYRNREVANLMFSGALPVNRWPEELHVSAQVAINALRNIIRLGKQQNLYADFDDSDLTMTSLATVHGLAMFMNSGLLTSETASEAALKRLGKRAVRVLIDGMLKR